MTTIDKLKYVAFVEMILAILTIVGIVFVITFFYDSGYLPPPFFDNPDDTFMDWYNTAHWVYKPGAYEQWRSIYPPFSFIFLRIFSNPSCYVDLNANARNCDVFGAYALAAFMVLNSLILYYIYVRDSKYTAIPRAIALGFGMPMLFAWERGNLILPCFTFFILGHGRLLKAGWVRWVCLAAAINFKPYLVVTVAGRVLRRQWRWAEGCAVSVILIYVVSFMLLGQGSPIDLLSDIFSFSQVSSVVQTSSLTYMSTYNSLLDILQQPIPIMHFVGSRPIELLESILPIAIGLGELGVIACFAGAVWRPNALPGYRLAALSMAVLLTVTNPGGYAAVFLFFFVFHERWNHPGQVVALICTYLLCVPGDHQFVGIAHLTKNSYLSGRTVGYNFGLTVGGFVKPALLLMVEYGLVAVSLSDILRTPSSIARRRVRALFVEPSANPVSDLT